MSLFTPFKHYVATGYLTKAEKLTNSIQRKVKRTKTDCRDVIIKGYLKSAMAFNVKHLYQNCGLGSLHALVSCPKRITDFLTETRTVPKSEFSHQRNHSTFDFRRHGSPDVVISAIYIDLIIEIEFPTKAIGPEV